MHFRVELWVEEGWNHQWKYIPDTEHVFDILNQTYTIIQSTAPWNQVPKQGDNHTQPIKQPPPVHQLPSTLNTAEMHSAHKKTVLQLRHNTSASFNRRHHTHLQHSMHAFIPRGRIYSQPAIYTCRAVGRCAVKHSDPHSLGAAEVNTFTAERAHTIPYKCRVYRLQNEMWNSPFTHTLQNKRLYIHT